MQKVIRYPFVGMILGIILVGIVELVSLTLSPAAGRCSRIIGTLMVVYYFCKNKKHPFKNSPLIFKLFVYWNILIILRGTLIGNYRVGVTPSLFSVLNNIMSIGSPIAYLFPLIALMFVDMKMFASLKKLTIMLCFSYLFLLFTMKGYLLSQEFMLGRSEFENADGGV